MQSDLTIRGGPVPFALGATTTVLSGGRTSQLRVSDAHASYFDSLYNGVIYSACNQSVVTFGTALTATAVTFTLYNPLGSTKILVPLLTNISIVTCVTGGSLVYAINNNPLAVAPATNTPLTVVSNQIGNKQTGVGIAYSVTTLPAAPTAFMPVGGAISASSSAVGPAFINHDARGFFGLYPNTAVTIQGITIAGTGLIGMSWAEEPI